MGPVTHLLTIAPFFASVAQWQSVRLLSGGLQVQALLEALGTRGQTGLRYLSDIQVIAGSSPAGFTLENALELESQSGL